MKALCFDRFGGPEVLVYRDVPNPDLRPGRALVYVEAIGLNFADIYRCRGRCHGVGAVPYQAGEEGAGRVIAFDGEGPFHLDDRIACADSPRVNAEHAAVADDKFIALPEDVSCDSVNVGYDALGTTLEQTLAAVRGGGQVVTKCC